MPSNDSFDTAWIAVRDDTFYKGLMDSIDRYRRSRKMKEIENYIRNRDQIRAGREFIQSLPNRPGAPIPPPTPEPSEEDDFGDFDFGDDDGGDDGGRRDDPEIWMNEESHPDDFENGRFRYDGEDNDGDGVVDGDPEDDNDGDGVADASLAEEMNDEFVAPQILATPAKDEDVFVEPPEGKAKEITSKPKTESTHSSVRDNLKAQIEAKRNEADAAREPTTYPSIFASTEPSVIRELIAAAEDGDEGARKHLYGNEHDLKDLFPSLYEEAKHLFAKAKPIYNDVADSSFILKNPFANPFSNPQAFALNEKPNPQREYVTPIIKSEPPQEKPDIGFDVVKGDDLSLLPASLFATNGPGGDDMSLLPSGWKIDQ